MSTHIRIRSIYATALTKLLMDSGYAIVDPSMKIQERLGIACNDAPPEILIQDRDDFQGVEISGLPERVCQFLTFLQERLLDPVLLTLATMENDETYVMARVEFPGASKEFLDAVRLSITPTLGRHHRLRILDSKALERAEMHLGKHPEKKDALEHDLFKELIMLPLEKSGVVRLEHMRPSGKPMRPREGILMDADEKRIVFKRSFSQGRYDGLDLPIEPGDYGLTEIIEGKWYVKHSYHTKDGKLIGEYYNINTPVELYPYGARYLDLEVDVIRRADEEPFLIDREKLALLTRHGVIGPALENQAMAVAENVMQKMAI